MTSPDDEPVTPNLSKTKVVKPSASFLNLSTSNIAFGPTFAFNNTLSADRPDKPIGYLSIISFLKPGVLKVLEGGSEEKKYYVEDGIIEFKNNCLSVLTSNIFDISEANKTSITEIINNAEKEAQDNDLDDQKRYLIEQKIEVLKSISTIN